MTVLVLAARKDIAQAFLGSTAAQAPEAADLVAVFLIYGAIFFVFDGIQTTASGALRGIQDTRVPLLMAAVGFWIVGFAGSYILAFVAGFGPKGIWIGLTVGLVVFALLLTARFHRLTQRGYLPS
jgi:MATE family multidrug resistance protein